MGSNDFTNYENAGLAKTGYSINLMYGYNIKKNIGIAAGIFYNNYPVDETSMEELFDGSGITISLDLEYWKFYGIAAGPMFTLDDWGAAATLHTGLNLRVGTAKKMFFFGNIDFTYLNPTFEYEYMDENNNWVKEDIHQKISVINVTAGVGIRL